jgi:hypothetical protein
MTLTALATKALTLSPLSTGNIEKSMRTPMVSPPEKTGPQTGPASRTVLRRPSSIDEVSHACETLARERSIVKTSPDINYVMIPAFCFLYEASPPCSRMSPLAWGLQRPERLDQVTS